MKSRYLQANDIETRSNLIEEDPDSQFFIQPIKSLPSSRPPVYLTPLKLSLDRSQESNFDPEEDLAEDSYSEYLEEAED